MPKCTYDEVVGQIMIYEAATKDRTPVVPHTAEESEAAYRRYFDERAILLAMIKELTDGSS